MGDPNQHLLNRLNGIQAILLAQYRASAGLPSAAKGSEREVFLREFLQRIYPSHRRFATGAITDAFGNLSGQVDIAIEYGHVPSLPLSITTERLMLAECVAAVIEVKSDLSKQWGEVESTTRAVKVLRRRFVNTLTQGDPKPPESIPVLAVGYTGYKTIDSLRARWLATEKESRPDGLLVIDTALCIYDGKLIMSKLEGQEQCGTGPYAFFRFLIAVQQRLASLIAVSPDYDAYIGN